SSLMAASVLAWIPRKHFRITYLGSRTLYVYLLHGFFIQYFRQADMFKVDTLFDLAGLAGLSSIIVWLLSAKPVLGIWQPFIEGKLSILKSMFRRSDDQHQQSA